MRKKSVNKTIKRAIDSYPGGICFSAPDGRIILSNKKMNDLVLELTGYTVLNAETTWRELSKVTETGKTKQLKQPWLPIESNIRKDSSYQQLFFQFSDASVWRFEYIHLDDVTIQIEAADITRLYRLSEELYKNSIKLKEMQKQQQLLLENIVQMNQSKEILTAKMRIHDEFGRCLLATNKAISEKSLDENAAMLREKWKDSIHNFLNVPESTAETNHSLQAELLQVAELIGCKIIFHGKLPTDQRTLHLLYPAIREALTNAVRHANATELSVKIEREQDHLHVEITDNGTILVSEITEGTGLGALRERLEQDGASLKILCHKHVTLSINIP